MMIDAIPDRATGGRGSPPRSGIEASPAAGSDDAACHADPASIVGDHRLSRAQRLRLLDDWAQDLADRQVATAEGMLPPSPSEAAAEAQMLRSVNAGIATVEAASADHEGPLARAWRRLTLD